MTTFFTEIEQAELLAQVEHGDYRRLSDYSRKAGLKDGAGYSAPTIKSAIKNRNTISQALKDLILEYFEKKKVFSNP